MKRFFGAALLLLAVHAAHADSDDTLSSNPAISQQALVSTIRLAPGSLPATMRAYGQIQAAPGAEMTITLAADGIVAALPVAPGERVMAGDVLAMITPDAPSVAERRKAFNALAAARAQRVHVASLRASRLATVADLAAADQVLADAAASLTALERTGAGVARVVRAPQAGIVSSVLASPGSAQPAGAELLRIIGDDALVAVVGVTPAQASAMRPGDAARLTILGTGTILAGRLTRLAAMTDAQTGLIGVTLAAPGAALLGAPVEADITTGILTGYVVPRDAVQTDEQGDYAFQLDPHDIAHRVAVRVLGTQGDQTVLAPDLNAALPLVTTGAYQLDDGAAVRLAPPSGPAF